MSEHCEDATNSDSDSEDIDHLLARRPTQEVMGHDHVSFRLMALIVLTISLISLRLDSIV